MDEKDRVFARFRDDKPAAAGRREVMTVPRRAGVSGTRTVEVVRARIGATTTAKNCAPRPRPPAVSAVREGPFPAWPAPQEPAVPPAAHAIPAHEPDLVAAEAVNPDVPTTVAENDPPRAEPRRRFADPFDPADTDANCLRCGYAVEPPREAHGFLTCAGCG